MNELSTLGYELLGAVLAGAIGTMMVVAIGYAVCIAILYLYRVMNHTRYRFNIFGYRETHEWDTWMQRYEKKRR